MDLTGPQLRVLVAGHARAEAAATARLMSALRTAVWADAEGFAGALDALAATDDDDDDWLMRGNGDEA